MKLDVRRLRFLCGEPMIGKRPFCGPLWRWEESIQVDFWPVAESYNAGTLASGGLFVEMIVFLILRVLDLCSYPCVPCILHIIDTAESLILIDSANSIFLLSFIFHSRVHSLAPRYMQLKSINLSGSLETESATNDKDDKHHRLANSRFCCLFSAAGLAACQLYACIRLTREYRAWRTSYNRSAMVMLGRDTLLTSRITLSSSVRRKPPRLRRLLPPDLHPALEWATLHGERLQ